MPKTLTKRSFPKISKWGKFLKLGRSKKKKNKTIHEQEQLDEVNHEEEKQETTGLISDKTTVDNAPELNKENHKPEQQIDSESLSFEEAKKAVKIDLCRTFEQDAKSNGDISSHVLDKKVKSKCTSVAFEHDGQPKSNDKCVQSANVNSSTKSVDLVSLNQELVSVQTPSPKLQEKGEFDEKKDENDEDLAFPILLTPSPKVKRNGQEKDQIISVMKDTSKKNDIIDEDQDLVFEAANATPSEKKLDKRDRVLTVKKIRSIIATPYKRLRREGSLLDGQTYRYIEIQSLVSAFQSMHPCIGSMIACNEKGLQYGKSSVLRIECKECNTKVFLQASKN